MNLPRECEKCGYSLRKQPAIGSCPECGEGFTNFRFQIAGLTAWRTRVHLLSGCAGTVVGVAIPVYYVTEQFTQQLSTIMLVGLSVFVLIMAISIYSGIRLSKPMLITHERLTLPKVSGPKIVWADVERLEIDDQKLQCVVHYKADSRFSIRHILRLMSDRIAKITGFENAAELSAFSQIANQFIQSSRKSRTPAHDPPTARPAE